MAIRRRTASTVAASVATMLVVAVVLSGCGSEDRVALAIQGAVRANGEVALTVECATDIEIDQRPDPGGSGLDQVTVWGTPKVGRCHPDAALDELPKDKFIDGATSQAVEVELP